MKELKLGKVSNNIRRGVETSHKGMIREVSYDELVSVFGEPHFYTEYENNKSDVEWVIEYADGTVVTIYDWKTGRNFLGDEGVEFSQNTEWNIGGNRKGVANLVIDELKEN